MGGVTSDDDATLRCAKDGLEPAGAGPEARLFTREHAPRDRRRGAAVADEHVDEVDLRRALIGASAVVIRRFVTGRDDRHAVVVGGGAGRLAVVAPARVNLRNASMTRSCHGLLTYLRPRGHDWLASANCASTPRMSGSGRRTPGAGSAGRGPVLVVGSASATVGAGTGGRERHHVRPRTDRIAELGANAPQHALVRRSGPDQRCIASRSTRR